MSLTMKSPVRSYVRLTTEDQYVSMDILIEGNSATRTGKTGERRLHSSSSPTGNEPGRVEHAPISMMSAPSSSMRETRSSTAPTEPQRLSGKYESSVRFTIPIISTLRFITAEEGQRTHTGGNSGRSGFHGYSGRSGSRCWQNRICP